MIRRAVDLARRLGDNDTIWWAAAVWFQWAFAPQHARERLHLVEELMASSRAGLRQASIGAGLFHVAFTLLDWGQRRRAEEVWREYREYNERVGGAYSMIGLALFNGLWATIDGRLEEAGQTARGMLSRGEELGITGFAALFALHAGCRAWLLLGKAGEALQFVKTSIPLPPCVALCLAYLGQATEVVKLLEQFVVNRPGIGSAEVETWVMYDILYLEAAVLVKHRQAAELLLSRFASSFSPFVSNIALTCTARHLGGASALLGRYDEARKYYQEAIKVCTEMKFRPEIALTRLQLAELLLEHYPDEKKEAVEHLDFAIKEFREMKMQPSLERALRHKEILKT